MDNETNLKTLETEALICELRGRKVILDYQLANLYGVETKNLKRAVKANMNRFPEDFMFELTKEEFEILRCRNFTSKGRGGTRYMPYAFTQEGVAMLSGLLRSDVAVQANIFIMRAFVKMRTTLAFAERVSMDLEQLKHQVSELNHYLEDVMRDQNDINEETSMQLQLINESLAEMRVKEKTPATQSKKIGFKTQVRQAPSSDI
ncbi:MAG: ORF6N domain-containing protein [Bacteroidales bacterium]|nr:ORF6N domain-containing protein [Bacteroidales bacterium]